MKCLIVGHGPSCTNYDFIRDFNGIIVSADITAHELIENGIVPDYMCFFETQQAIRHNLHTWIPDSFSEDKVRNKMTLIYRLPITGALTYRIEMMKLKWGIFELNEYGDFHADKINNVGLYSIAFATDILKMSDIHLIGMEYEGLDNQGINSSKKWIESARWYMKNRILTPNIIDHSGGAFPLL